MKFFLIAVPSAAVATVFAWRISQMLSPDAIAMGIGMLLGTLAGLPAAALVLVASRRTPDYAADVDYIDAPTVSYADEVTPYTHLFRRAAGMPALPDRQAQIAELEAYLNHLKSGEVS